MTVAYSSFIDETSTAATNTAATATTTTLTAQATTSTASTSFDVTSTSAPGNPELTTTNPTLAQSTEPIPSGGVTAFEFTGLVFVIGVSALSSIAFS